MQNNKALITKKKTLHLQILNSQGRCQDLELRRAVLLLTVCGGFDFWFYCSADKGFFFIFLFYVCVECVFCW